MKVSEAKTKVCPFIYNMMSTALGESEGGNINCICGDCMAWEWEKTNVIDGSFIKYDSGYCQRLKQ